MTGCRHNAKNTLVKNYLYLAERGRGRGASADHGAPGPAAPRRRVRGRDATAPGAGRRAAARRPRTFTADQVIFAAGALGTAKLLHAMRDDGTLPDISPRVGRLTRTNSEAILAARARGARRRLQPRGGDHLVDPPRPGHARRAGALRQRLNLLALLGTVLVDGDQPVPRWRAGAARAAAQPARPARSCRTRGTGRSRRSSCWSCRRWTTRSPRRCASGAGFGRRR